MEFIDKTGHIFSLPSYSSYPTGYEYDESPYIFWVNETGKLSINNYYIKTIRVVIDSTKYSEIDDNTHLSIKLDSKFFNLLGSLEINNLLKNNKNPFDYISINKDIIKTELTEDDVILLTNLTDEYNNKYSMFSFYILAYSEKQDVMLSNILIDIYNELTEEHDYCPVTVGGEFVDENEMLVINGKNLGISLPKDILKAIYKSSFYNYASDEYLYNTKLKELLLNYMDIKGECGNYKSAINALKWFEWGDKLKIVKLLETDNNFISQFILDKFDIKNDVISSYKLFRNTTYIKLFIEGTEELDEINPQNFNNDLWGEGKPKVHNLIDSNNYVKYNEGDIKFYKPYYDFLFDELGLKLSALEYYYKKFFLPIHLFIHNSSIQFQCFINDNKFLVGENKTIFTENPQITYDIKDNIHVEFPKNDYIMLNTQSHFVDEHYNEFNKYIIDSASINPNSSNVNDMLLYWVNENCLSIPIKFSQFNTDGSEKQEQYYDCNLILDKLEKSTYNYLYSFLYGFDYDEFFTLNLSDENGNITDKVLISHKKYKSNYNNQRLESTEEWSDYMSYEDTKKYIIENYIRPLPFNIEKPTINIRIKSITYIKTLKAGMFDYIKYSICDVIDDTHEVIFESNFRFIQNIDKPETYYRDFVIVPKVFGKRYDINFWLNNEFNLYLSVNGKWHTYNFICKVPEFQLEIGKLFYKYYLDVSDSFVNQHGNVSMFRQINKLSDGKVEFNRFMWQPNLVKVNNIDFFDNLLNYYKDYKYNITYNKESKSLDIISDIEGNTDSIQDIKLNDLYYVLTLNDQKFYIHNDVILNYFIRQNNNYFKLELIQLSEYNKDLNWLVYYSNNNLDFINIYNETNYSDSNKYKGSSGILNTNEHENVIIVNEDGQTLKFNTIVETDVDTSILDSSKYNNYVVVLEDENAYSNRNSLLIYFELDKNNNIKFYLKDIYNNPIYLSIEKTIYKNINVLLDKYKEFPNIVNNKKYLSKVHLYDIYKNGKLLKYNKLTQKEEADLYNIFFNQDEQYTSKLNIPESDDVYDFYLMHNNEQWYSLFISKLPQNIYKKTLLDISDNKKEFIYNNSIDKVYIDITEEGIKDYYNINTAILNKICFDNKLLVEDLYIVFNEIGLDGDENSNDFETLLHSSLINKVFNRNIGANPNSLYNDEYYIIWNDHLNNMIVSQNWNRIHPNDIYCPYCGESDYIEVQYSGDKYTVICKNHDPYKILANDLTLGSDSILKWNDSSIPYKLIYSLNNDENYHKEVEQRYAQYTFSMNNSIYYINGKKNEETGKIEYFLQDDTEPIEINTEYNGYNIEDLYYDSYRDTYVANVYNEVDGQYHNYDYIKGLNNNLINHYIYLDSIVIYTDVINDYQKKYLNNFYIFYDGNSIYNDDWYMLIDVSPDNIETTNIIKFYKRSDNSELKWIINPEYNYNTDIYKYCYDYLETKYYELATSNDKVLDSTLYIKLNEELYIPISYKENWYDDMVYYYLEDNEYKVADITNIFSYDTLFIEYDNTFVETEVLSNETLLYKQYEKTIEFNNGQPVTPIYIDNQGYFFDLVFKDNKWQKRIIYRKLINENVKEGYSLYDVNTGIFYKEGADNVILNTPEWINSHNINIPSKPYYDGLYYLYYETEETINDEIKVSPHWQVLVYINNEVLDENIDWYYNINGHKYKYEGKVVSYIYDNDGNKIKQEILSTDYIIINLSDVGLDPIKVYLNVINETEKTPAYYNIVDEYKFKFVKSDDKFLINRMQYVSCNGNNHFNNDDIIVTSISPKMDKNNTEYKTEFKLNYSTKWIYKPMSLKTKDSALVSSNSEMGIMSIGDSNIKYERGYYNLICNYSLDGNTENIYSKTARILIK